MSDPAPGNPPSRDSRDAGKSRNRHRNRNRNARSADPARDGGKPRPQAPPHRKSSRPKREGKRKSRPSRQPVPAPAQGLLQRIVRILTFGLAGSRTGRRPAGAAPRAAPGIPLTTNVPPVDPDIITSPRIYVGNLDPAATETDLHNIFNGIGRVQSVDIVYSGVTYQSQGCGFVEMMTVLHARRAVEELHGKPFMGRPLLLGPAEPRGTDPREADDAGSAD